MRSVVALLFLAALPAGQSGVQTACVARIETEVCVVRQHGLSDSGAFYGRNGIALTCIAVLPTLNDTRYSALECQLFLLQLNLHLPCQD